MIRKAIPNLITLGNLFFGLMGLYYLWQPTVDPGSEHIFYACLCVFGAALCDLFDGMAARLLKVSSPLGKELDSLCDGVSFGVLPSFILLSIIRQEWISFFNIPDPFRFFFPFLIAIATVYRLAKFNVDTRQSVDFMGMPSPAQGIFTACLGVVIAQRQLLHEFVAQPLFLFLYILLVSYIMVSDLPLKSLKLKKGGPKAYLFHGILLLAGIILFISFSFTGLFLTIIFYVIWSLLFNFTPLKNIS